MTRANSWLARATAAACVVAVGGCVSGPEVRAVSDKTANFASYKTFGFASPLGTDSNGYQSIVSQDLKAAVERQLVMRGLHFTDDKPQLIVNFSAALADKFKATTTSTPTMAVGMGYGRGYYGYRGGMYTTWPLYQDQTTITQYKEGTLNIDVADAAKKQLVWEAVVSGSVTQKHFDQLDATIEKAVTSAFAKFPIAPVK